MNNLVQTQPASLTAADQNPVLVYLGSLGSSSRRTMRNNLDAIASLISDGQVSATEFGWHQLRYQHTAAIRAALQERYAPATANKALAALRQVLKQCWRLQQMSAEDYQRAADIRNIKNETLPAGRAIASAEITAILKTCKGTIADTRDAALFGILRAGLRRSEVAKLDVADFDPSTGGLQIRGGKGRKDRLCYLPDVAAALVLEWLQIRGTQPGALLQPVSKSGRILSRRLSDQAVHYILQQRARLAGISVCSPHDWRRTFVGDLLDAGADLSTVQKLAGHSSPSTTAKYDRRGEAAKRRAANLLKM